MSSKQPAMSPSDMPISDVLARATGPRRAEADILLAMHREISGHEPVVWAGRILGFGEYEYRYESGHGGKAPILGYAPGAAQHTIYLGNDFSTRWPDLLERLGKHRASKTCLYLTRLTGVDHDVLREVLVRTRDETLSQWP